MRDMICLIIIKLIINVIFFQKSQNCSLISAFGATSNGGKLYLFYINEIFYICIKFRILKFSL